MPVTTSVTINRNHENVIFESCLTDDPIQSVERPARESIEASKGRKGLEKK